MNPIPLLRYKGFKGAVAAVLGKAPVLLNSPALFYFVYAESYQRAKDRASLLTAT